MTTRELERTGFGKCVEIGSRYAICQRYLKWGGGGGGLSCLSYQLSINMKNREFCIQACEKTVFVALTKKRKLVSSFR